MTDLESMERIIEVGEKADEVLELIAEHSNVLAHPHLVFCKEFLDDYVVYDKATFH